MNWFSKPPKPCESCSLKDETIHELRNQVAELLEVRATMSKLEELARLEKRQQDLIDSIQMLTAKRKAEEKASREVPPNWMSARQEGRLPPL